MADLTITQLPADATLTGTEEVPIMDAGVTKKTTVQAIADLAAGGVSSVNGETGTVVLDAADVGADVTGTAAGLILDHIAAVDPHPGYLTPAEGDLAYSAINHNHALENLTEKSYNSLTDKPTIPSIAGLLNETAHDLLDHTGLIGIPAQYTDEMAQDAVGAAIAAGTQTGITVSYDDLNNKIDFTVTASGGGDVTGPASATDGNIPLFDGITGKVIKNSAYSPTSFAAALGADDNYVTDAEKVKLANLSGTNTGDQDLSSYALTSQLHPSVTVTDSSSINLPLTGQDVTADAIFGTTSGTVAQGNDPRFVTNGDSHDHAGGDGAQIAYSSLSGLPSIPSVTGLLDETAHDALDHTGLTGVPAAYTLPTASTTVLGGVKIDGTSITIADGVISSNGGGAVIPYQNDAPSTPSDGDLWVDKDATAGTAASGVSQTTPISLGQGASTNITGITVVVVSTLAAPTYTTTYGTGDRRAIITVTHSGGWYRTGDIQLLVNGQTAGGVGQNVGLYPIGNTGCTIVFSFSAPQLITELKFHTATGVTYGDWVVQGSADNVSWSANLCASTAMVPLSTVFDMSANTTAYNYYRLLGVGGTIGDGYFHEAEFKIGATEYILSTPGVDYKTTRSNSSGVQTLTITRLASGTADMVIDYI